MRRNIDRMQSRMNELGVRFRPHVKTTKCLRDRARAGARPARSGITVSTLKEAEQFFAAGFRDILYAVGIVPGKLGQVLALRKAGCDLKLITDNAGVAAAIGRFGQEQQHRFEVWLEIDTDGHRSGIVPEADDAARRRACAGRGRQRARRRDDACRLELRTRHARSAGGERRAGEGGLRARRRSACAPPATPARS